ncbi:MAG: hypothetical protein F6K48_20975 [Okeania sp. SIO3H1]|nr:hypothetical protein [Okeania sp. SIO3H1]
MTQSVNEVRSQIGEPSDWRRTEVNPPLAPPPPNPPLTPPRRGGEVGDA